MKPPRTGPVEPQPFIAPGVIDRDATTNEAAASTFILPHGLPGSLGAAVACIGRAHYHVSELRRVLKEWVDSQPYTITRLQGRSSETVIDRADLAGARPPFDAALIVSDAVHEARAALDNLVNALRLDGPAPAVRFLIVEDEADYDRQASDALRGLPDWAIRVIRSLQPFEESGQYVGGELARLHDLARIDRHRVLPLQAAILQPSYVEGTVEAFRGDGRTWAETEYRPELVLSVHFDLEARFASDAPSVADFEVNSAASHLITVAGSVVQTLLDEWRRRPRDIARP
jgi:hypothetical protein